MAVDSCDLSALSLPFGNCDSLPQRSDLQWMQGLLEFERIGSIT